MRKYEFMVIIHPRHDERSAKEVIQKLSDLIASSQGQVNKTNVWGRRRLAYTIKNQTEGTYVLFNMEMLPSALRDMEFTLKLDEDILRYMIVQDIFDEEESAEAEEAEAETEAEAEAETVAEVESSETDAEASEASAEDQSGEDEANAESEEPATAAA